MANNAEFDELVNNMERLSTEGLYEQLCETLNKSYETLNKNIPLLDSLFDKLDLSQHSIIIMAILYVKFHSSSYMDYELAYIQFQEFINTFDITQIMYPLDIFMNLCHLYTEVLIKQKIPIKGIMILNKALTKISSSPNQLTSLHADICHLCLSSRCLNPAFSILDIDIQSIMKEGKSFDSKYYLLYYYYGGLIYLAYKNYERALHFFEQAITAPAIVVSLIMVEAFKKYILTSLILHSKVINLPKYTSNVVSRFIKPLCQAYIDIAQTYMSNNHYQLDSKISEYSEVLNRDGNMGLMKICRKAFFKNNIKKLTKIYLTLSLTDLASLAKLPNPQIAEQFLVEMIASGDIFGHINKQDDIVTFSEDPETYTDLEMQNIIDKQAEHCMNLQNLINGMSKDIGLNPQFIQKSMGISDDEPVGTSKMAQLTS